MSLRTSTDNGEIDGYFGQLDMEAVIANPKNFKKLETPEGMKTTLYVSAYNSNGPPTRFLWRCAECDEVIETDKFKRPLHTCNPEIKAKVNAEQEAETHINH